MNHQANRRTGNDGKRAAGPQKQERPEELSRGERARALIRSADDALDADPGGAVPDQVHVAAKGARVAADAWESREVLSATAQEKLRSAGRTAGRATADFMRETMRQQAPAQIDPVDRMRIDEARRAEERAKSRQRDRDDRSR